MTQPMPAPSSIPAVILAGGRSSRMGNDKACATLGGRSLLATIAARLSRQTTAIALNADRQPLAAEELRLAPDTIEGKAGPLAGVLAALRDASLNHPAASHVATVPVDSPFFPPDLLVRLAESISAQDEIAIATSNGRAHPVFGLWPVSLADDLETWLRRDQKRRMQDFLARHVVRAVDFAMIETPGGTLDPFFNINTPADLAAANVWLEAMPQ